MRIAPSANSVGGDFDSAAKVERVCDNDTDDVLLVTERAEQFWIGRDFTRRRKADCARGPAGVIVNSRGQS